LTTPLQIGLEPDLVRFRNSNPAGTGAGHGENLFWEQRTIYLMKLMVSAMTSAAINRQCSSVLPLLCYSLPVFDEIYGTAMNFLFFFYHPITLIKTANTQLALVLSVIN